MRPPGSSRTDSPPEVVPPRFHVMAKPTGAVCNLACTYCFFLDKELLYPGSPFRMTGEALEAYIRQLIEGHETPQVTVAWQGGEPTLMGLDFFRTAIELQERYRRPGMTFENTMQTNGTLLDDEWCEFLAENDYLVGLSLDGPRQLHDAYRVNKDGRGTFDRVMRGVRLLQKHGVEYNILTTVNRINADYPLEVYRFLRDEVGTEWIQLIPIVERLDSDGLALRQEGTEVSERSVQPEQFGRFMTTIFDEWVGNDVGRVYVQTFEAAVRNWLGMASSGMCVFNENCGAALALEHNGDVYSCDHYVEPKYRLGNIADTQMVELLGSDQQRQFGRDKSETLPGQCRRCEVRFACHGECPKSRFAVTADGEQGLHYLCAGWYEFFTHIDHPAKTIAALLEAGQPASDVMAVMGSEVPDLETMASRAPRNSPCPCGSGLKVKHCHGRSRTTPTEPTTFPVFVAEPRPRVTRTRINDPET
ncbi:MAG: anaerobic sulfatase maturase [Actinomycetia bacterium]|nr:anaerobic sulfatase maturase [Actinomycetes bacterium]